MTDFRIESQGFTWEPDPDFPGHDTGDCDACDNGESAESCTAWVLVSYPLTSGASHRRLQRFESAGLFGICGASPAYRQDVEKDEWADLVDHCAAFGVSLARAAQQYARSTNPQKGK